MSSPFTIKLINEGCFFNFFNFFNLLFPIIQNRLGTSEMIEVDFEEISDICTLPTVIGGGSISEIWIFEAI